MILALSSCRNYTEPKLDFEVLDWTANTTIAELKALHPITNPSEAPKLIDTDVIIKGIVTANDLSGNIYKSIYIQDATGGINISMDQVNLYNYFPLGQTVFAKLNGLYIGDYRGLPQIGFVDANGTLSCWDFIWEVYVDPVTNTMPYKHFFASGLPDSAAVPAPKVFTSADFTTADVGLLVKFENAYFPDASMNLPFADKDVNTSRTLNFEGGGSVIVRTSGYSNFYADLLPKGVGNVTGILTIFGSTYQLLIRDREDVSGFVEE